jgi:hypothetical protein
MALGEVESLRRVRRKAGDAIALTEVHVQSAAKAASVGASGLILTERVAA